MYGANLVSLARGFQTVACGLLLVSALLVAACSKTPSEQALRTAVAALQNAIQARDAAALDEYLSEDFIGPDGLDRKGARRLATLHMMRHDRIGMTLGPMEVQLRGQHATVRFTAAMTAGEGRLFPDSGRIYDVETGWRLDGDEWLLISADWQRQL